MSENELGNRQRLWLAQLVGAGVNRMLLPEMREVPIDPDFPGAVFRDQTVTVAITTLDHDQVGGFFALRTIGGLHEPRFGGIGKMGGGSGKRWIEPSHLRNDPVAVEILRLVLVDGAVSIAVDQSTHPTSANIHGTHVGRDPVWVGSGKDVNRCVVKQFRMFGEHHFADPNRVLRAGRMKPIDGGDHEDGRL